MKLSEPQKYILTSAAPVNLFLAGVGSGKTHLGGIITGHFIESCPHVFGFIGANTYNQLNTSTMYRIREVWRDVFGWIADKDYVIGKKPPGFFNTQNHNFDRYDGILSHKNGAVVFVGSLDNAKAHDGKQFAWAVLDETKDTREEDVKETILTRLRQPGMYVDKRGQLSDKGLGVNPMYILTSPAKVKWINEWFGLDAYRAQIETQIMQPGEFFRLDTGGKCVAISSTHHNAANLPPDYIDKVIENHSTDRATALIYGSPFSRAGGEFYSGFSAIRHTGTTIYKKGLPLHITFDQNVVPYITANVWQVHTDGDKWALHQIDEFNLPSPNNTTERLCDAILAKYGAGGGQWYFYGDASGNSRSTKSAETDYQIVARKFRPHLVNGSNRTNRVNPPVLLRRDFINMIFEGKTSFAILIDSRNKNTISDYTYLKEDANGAKLKQRVKDEATGGTYELYGHASDANDYFIAEICRNAFNAFRQSK